MSGYLYQLSATVITVIRSRSMDIIVSTKLELMWPSLYHLCCVTFLISLAFRPDVIFWMCDLRHMSRVFVLVCPSSDESFFLFMWSFRFHLRDTSGALSWSDLRNISCVVWPSSYHSPFVLMWHFGCDLHHLSRVFVLVCPSSDQLCFVTMWPFGLDLLHTSGVFSKCDLYISCVTFLFVLLWTLDVSSVIYVVFLCLCDLRTFWIRPSFNKSCFVLMWPLLCYWCCVSFAKRRKTRTGM